MFCHWICMFFCPIEQLSLPDLDLVSLWNSKDQWHLLFQMKLMFVCTFQWSFWLSTSKASVSQSRCSDVLVCCASGPSTSLSLSLSVLVRSSLFLLSNQSCVEWSSSLRRTAGQCVSSQNVFVFGLNLKYEETWKILASQYFSNWRLHTWSSTKVFDCTR